MSTLFDFISTFGITFLFFILPSLFLILTQDKFKPRETTEGRVLRVLAFVVIAIGVVIFGLGMYVNVTNLINRKEE